MSFYFDNNATTPLDPLVLEEMFKDYKGGPLNPSSVHFFGKKARALLLESKKKIGSCLKILDGEIIFTSGGTEAINLLILGSIEANDVAHIVTSDIEHLSIYNTLSKLNRIKTTYLKTGSFGAVKPSQILDSLTPQTRLIILSAVNTETGVLTDINAIAKIAKERRISFIVDGVGILGKRELFWHEGISAMAFSPHKIHGPKGIGFLYLKKDHLIHAQQLGGHQEYNLRAGTENLAGILGSAKAVELSYENLEEKIKYIQSLRDRFEENLRTHLSIQVNGDGPRICNTSNIAFDGIESEDLLIKLDLRGICASHGSACSSNSIQLSRVLLNMGYPTRRVKSSIRFSFSRMNTIDEIEEACKIIISSVKELS